jgi:hypothetical protein
MAYGRSAECGQVYWLREDGTIPPHQHGRALLSCPGGGQPPTERCKRNGDRLAQPKPRLPRWALKYGAWSSLARLYQASAPLPDELISGIYSLPADKWDFVRLFVPGAPNRGQWCELNETGRTWVEANIDRHVALYPGTDPRTHDPQLWHRHPHLRPFQTS